MNDSNGYDAARMPYSVYTLPESIQYVSMPSQSAETDSINAEPSNAIPSYAEPGSYPYTGYSGIASYAGGNIGGGYNPGAFAVQSGYDGYLVPTKPVEEKAIEPKSNNELPFIGAIQNTINSLTNSLPTSLRATGSLVGQAFTVLAGILGLTVLGGTLTTAICTFTPLCTISFALPFARSSLRSLAKPFVGEQNAELLDSTLMRLTKMQNEEKDKLTAKSTPNNSDGSVSSSSSNSAATVDAVAVKSLDGTDITADIAGTIAKVAKVTKAVAASVPKTVPVSTASIDNSSNDK